MSQQHILIVLNDGAFQGASITTDRNDPAPLDLTALSALIPDINAAAITKAQAADVQAADLNGKITELEALKTSMVKKVTDALETGDPSQFQAVAIDFLTPEQEKQRAEKMAQFESLKAELGIE